MLAVVVEGGEREDNGERRITPTKLRKLSSVTESLRLKQHCLYSPGSKSDLKGRKEASSHFCMSHSMALAQGK